MAAIQDVSELFNILFDALEKSFKGTRGDGIIKALYEGAEKTYVKCLECGTESGFVTAAAHSRSQRVCRAEASEVLG